MFNIIEANRFQPFFKSLGFISIFNMAINQTINTCLSINSILRTIIRIQLSNLRTREFSHRNRFTSIRKNPVRYMRLRFLTFSSQDTRISNGFRFNSKFRNINTRSYWFDYSFNKRFKFFSCSFGTSLFLFLFFLSFSFFIIFVNDFFFGFIGFVSIFNSIISSNIYIINIERILRRSNIFSIIDNIIKIRFVFRFLSFYFIIRSRWSFNTKISFFLFCSFTNHIFTNNTFTFFNNRFQFFFSTIQCCI